MMGRPSSWPRPQTSGTLQSTVVADTAGQRHALIDCYCHARPTPQAVIETLDYLKQSPELAVAGGLENAMSMVRMCSEINPEGMGNAANIDAIFDVGKMFDGNACVVSSVAASLKALCHNRRAASGTL